MGCSNATACDEAVAAKESNKLESLVSLVDIGGFVPEGVVVVLGDVPTVGVVSVPTFDGIDSVDVPDAVVTELVPADIAANLAFFLSEASRCGMVKEDCSCDCLLHLTSVVVVSAVVPAVVVDVDVVPAVAAIFQAPLALSFWALCV